MTPDPHTPLNQLPPNPLRGKLSPDATPAAALDESSFVPATDSTRPVEVWMRRLAVLLFVFVCAGAGVLLVILPWRPEWTDNHLLTGSPWLRAFVASGFVRGMCSGLGVLDIWIGFWEAVHYHEGKRAM